MTDLKDYTVNGMNDFLTGLETAYSIEFKGFLFDLLEVFKNGATEITEEEMNKIAEPYSMGNPVIGNFYYDLFDGKGVVDRNEIILSMLSIDYFFNTYDYGDTILIIFVDFFNEFYNFLFSINFFQGNDLGLYVDLANKEFTYFDRNLFYILKNNNFDDKIDLQTVNIEYEGITDFSDKLTETKKECPEFIDYLLRKSLKTFNYLHLSNQYDNILEDAYKKKQKSNADMAGFDSMFGMSSKERSITSSEFSREITKYSVYLKYVKGMNTEEILAMIRNFLIMHKLLLK